MQTVSATGIRDFCIRGNYFSWANFVSWQRLHASEKEPVKRRRPGCSPAVVDLELQDGSRSSMAVSESDIPFLCNDDLPQAKRYLSWIMEARSGEPKAAKELSATALDHSPAVTACMEPVESSFVVPCTSCEPHSEQTISQKGSTLLKLCRLGYPVPEFVVLTSAAYRDGGQHLEKHLAEAIEQLEVITMQDLGDAHNPLVFAVRCATTHYIPGVMDTYLNVGVTETSLAPLERIYGALPARKMLLNNLRNLCRLLPHDGHLDAVATVRPYLSPAEIDRLIAQFAEIIAKIDRNLLEDPFTQVSFLAKQAYAHFDENRDLVLTLCRGTEHYPSLILQKMICTVRHENAYAGVLSSRHTQTGVGVELQTAHNIFGEEMMTGTADIQSTAFEDPEAIKDLFPAVYHFAPHLAELEREFESPVTIEFAVEATSRSQWFALLQLNETAMAGRAAFTAAVDMHKSGAISRRRVTELIRPYHIKQLTSDTIVQEVFDTLRPFASGVSVLPRSAVTARVYFSSEAALKAKSRGERVCLCKTTFVPTDTVVMREMDAIISVTSAAIHVVTICQGLGIPALLNLGRSGVKSGPDEHLVNVGGMEIREGDWITISSKRHTIYLGQAEFAPGRLLRYMKGDVLELDEDERKTFPSIAYAYRYYQQLTKELAANQVSTLGEVSRLVNFEMRSDSEQASKLVNGWFDERETLYTEEVLKSDIGDHLGQSNVFEMLSLDRKIRFFKLALAKCFRERISGFEAGAFMLGRFLCMRYPTAFWKAFTPAEIGLLVNEWVLFEKYMQVLQSVGERKVLMARKQILKGGLRQLSLHPSSVQWLITLKLSGVPLQKIREALPAWADPQSAKVIEVLQQPYRAFYDFNSVWSLRQLERLCQEEHLPLPKVDDV